MSKNDFNVYGFTLDYKDNWLLVRQILRIYALVTNINKGDNFLRSRLADVLSFYILFDYSKETKNLIIKSLKITNKNLNQINAELTEKKFLIRDLHNFRKKHLSKDLVSLKKYFLDEENLNKFFLIKMRKDEG